MIIVEVNQQAGAFARHELNQYNQNDTKYFIYIQHLLTEQENSNDFSFTFVIIILVNYLIYPNSQEKQNFSEIDFRFIFQLYHTKVFKIYNGKAKFEARISSSL